MWSTIWESIVISEEHLLKEASMESSKSVNMFTAIASNQIKVRYALGIIDKTDVMHQIKTATKMTLIVIVKACPLSFFD